MAITSELGWIPAGTPHHSFWGTTGLPRTQAPVGDWEEMSTLTALVILYVTLPGFLEDLLPAPDISHDPGDVTDLWMQLLPTDPVPESAVSPHFGGGMWLGPGVRFYAC